MKNIFVLFISSLLLFSCKKEVKELPEATQTGAQTFGAKIDGNFWVPQGFGALPANDILESRMAGRNLIINARNFSSSPIETEFELHINNILAPGTYLFNKEVQHPSSDENYVYYVKRNFTPINEWINSSSHTGSVTITRIDTVALIASGTFQFTLENTSGNGETKTITDGRFDVKIQ